MAYRTVLIEENKMMMERLTSVVRNLAGFEVSARYATAGDALGQMQAFNPDLILVDVDNEHNALLIPDLKRKYSRCSHYLSGSPLGFRSAGKTASYGC